MENFRIFSLIYFIGESLFWTCVRLNVLPRGRGRCSIPGLNSRRTESVHYILHDIDNEDDIHKEYYKEDYKDDEDNKEDKNKYKEEDIFEDNKR